MHSSDRQFKTLGVFVLAGMLFLSGCATRKWVRNEIAPIGPRITAVENSGKENAERIDAVDRRAQQGITAATTAAATADTKGPRRVKLLQPPRPQPPPHNARPTPPTRAFKRRIIASTHWRPVSRRWMPMHHPVSRSR